MNIYAVFEGEKLVALCTETIAASTLQGELYYQPGDQIRVVKIDEKLWQQLQQLSGEPAF